MRHITNLNEFSNRTIDYLATAKPEAYQAHYRRISATKIANQRAKEKSTSEEKSKQPQQQRSMNQDQGKENESDKKEHQDLETRLPIDLLEHRPNHNSQHPKSAPATFNTPDKKTTVAHGEIPIGIEPPLSPLANMEIGC